MCDPHPAAYGCVVTRTADFAEQDPHELTWWDTTWRLGVAMFIGAAVWLATAATLFPDSPAEPGLLQGMWFVVVDPLLGLVAAVLLVLRRRWPVVVATATTLLTAGSSLAVGPQTVVLARWPPASGGARSSPWGS